MKKMKYEELTMKVDYLEPELAPISILPRDFSIGLAALLKGVLTRDHVHMRTSLVTGSRSSYRASRTVVCTVARIFPKSIGHGPRRPGFKKSWVVISKIWNLQHGQAATNFLNSLPEHNSFQFVQY
jgi:hypothetical protein